MKSKLKKAIVYDLETGGKKYSQNSITEIAMAAVDLESLEIVDTLNLLVKPYVDFNGLNKAFKGSSARIVKEIINNTAYKCQETNKKVVDFKGEKINLYNSSIIAEDLESFVKSETKFFDNNLVKRGLSSDKKGDVFKFIFNNAYNKEALEITNISIDQLESEGLEQQDVFAQVVKFIEKHTHGNSKPVLAGHNIGFLPNHTYKGKPKEANGFDNKFMDHWFNLNDADFFSMVNEMFIDTLTFSHLMWSESSSYNLSTTCAMMDVTLKNAHRAIADVEANAKMLIKMLKQFRGYGGSGTKKERKKYKLSF
jgi:DNA polymerase III alpha subunit (gram-positive type)